MVRFIILVIFALASPYALAMGNLPSNELTDSLIGKPAPEFTLQTVSGAQQSLTQARAGKKAVIFFWAAWCPHCRQELRNLAFHLQTIQNKGIQILLVDVGEAKEDVKAYLDHRKLPLDSFVDEDNTVAGRYGVEGIPTLFFIDEKGMVRAIEHEFPEDYQTRFHSK
ncbi:MAG: TlpA family protein disulfide reductase [Candidatus Omnitrophica bacterium]|nr:TlpA family protein disulfide reductase [Candidatus Omnitrophota bacterium]